jgi:hypothetical protein
VKQGSALLLIQLVIQQVQDDSIFVSDGHRQMSARRLLS